MTDCVFCKIVDGELPSRDVYEDRSVLAFLDANPLAPGHTLVIPKEHAAKLEDVVEAPAVWDVTRKLAPEVAEAVDAPAYNVGVNNGSAAGQEVPHVHMHIVPRFPDDGGNPIHAVQPNPPELSDDDLDGIAEKIRRTRDEAAADD